VERLEETESFQTKLIIKGNEKKCMFKEIWKNHNTNVLCWGFYCVNDGKKILSENLEIL